MAVDFAALCRNNFWKKKIRRVFQVRDHDRDGYITRADYVLIAERLKQLNVSTPSRLVKYTELLKKISNSFGLVDESVKYSYEDFEEKWINGMKEWVKSGTIRDLFGTLFDALDLNEDGFLSFKEWTAHCQTLAIDTAHARASFDAIDTNKDLKISRDEFIEYHMEFYLSVENKLNSAILFGPLNPRNNR